MERSFAPEASVTLRLDRSSAAPLYRQLYRGLREGILAGTLPAGSRLPSVRVLMRELKVSRNTVEGALAQLSAEGYLEARLGSRPGFARGRQPAWLRRIVAARGDVGGHPRLGLGAPQGDRAPALPARGTGGRRVPPQGVAGFGGRVLAASPAGLFGLR